MTKLYYSEEHGINSRLDEIQAAIKFSIKKSNLILIKKKNC